MPGIIEPLAIMAGKVALDMAAVAATAVVSKMSYDAYRDGRMKETGEFIKKTLANPVERHSAELPTVKDENDVHDQWGNLWAVGNALSKVIPPKESIFNPTILPSVMGLGGKKQYETPGENQNVNQDLGLDQPLTSPNQERNWELPEQPGLNDFNKPQQQDTEMPSQYTSPSEAPEQMQTTINKMNGKALPGNAQSNEGPQVFLEETSIPEAKQEHLHEMGFDSVPEYFAKEYEDFQQTGHLTHETPKGNTKKILKEGIEEPFVFPTHRGKNEYVADGDRIHINIPKEYIKEVGFGMRNDELFAPFNIKPEWIEKVTSSTGKNIYSKSLPGHAQSQGGLEQQAKKFKTAEEFIKNVDREKLEVFKQEMIDKGEDISLSGSTLPKAEWREKIFIPKLTDIWNKAKKENK